VNRRGTVAITYYDLRYLRPGNTTTLPTAMWYLTFDRSGRFSAERRISRVFDWLQAPYAGWGHFLGDYEGIAVDGRGFRPILAETNDAAPRDSTDAFSGVLPPNGPSARPPAAATTAALVPPPGRTAKHLHR
jgi:hypothetical protein